jgi:hypothetical protein
MFACSKLGGVLHMPWSEHLELFERNIQAAQAWLHLVVS